MMKKAIPIAIVLIGLGTFVYLGSVLVGCKKNDADETPAKRVVEKRETAVRVRVFAVTEETLNNQFELTGVAAPFRKATVSAEVPGRIMGRKVETGQRVKKGATLYTIDSERIRLDVKQATVTKAARQTDIAFAESELKRSDELVAAAAQPKRALDQARYNLDRAKDGFALAETNEARAKKALRDTTVRSPFAGRIARYYVEKGDYVGPGTPLATIIDLSKVRVTVGVTGRTADRIEPGKTAQVVFESLGGLTIEARVSTLAPALDPKTGTYPAELLLNNPDGKILAGMVGRIGLDLDSKPQLTVPREAVIRVDGQPHLFVVTKREGVSRAFRRKVNLGAMSGSVVEVLFGIERGDLVVVEGLFALRDGDRVAVENKAAVKGETE